MTNVVIQNVPPWNGSYDLGDADLTQREWGWIKRFTGYLPMTVNDGYRGGDPQLFGVLAVIALHRHGRIAAGDAADVFERFEDVPFGGAVRIEGDQDTAEVGVEDPTGSSNGKKSSSGVASMPSSESWAGPPSPTGSRRSATSASPSTTSAT